jgi:hypothetical protein
VFEIGTGEKCFARLADGQEIPMMQGPQGGFHLWLAVGCSDCSASAHLKWGVRDPVTGAPIPDTYDSEAFVPLSPGAWPQAAGIFATMPGVVWDPEGSPPLPKGTEVVLWADVLDGTTVTHHDQVRIIVGDTVPWDPCIEDPNHELCGFG